MPCLPPNAIIADMNSYLSFKTRLKCYILQDTFLVIINSLPPWSTFISSSFLASITFCYASKSITYVSGYPSWAIKLLEGKTQF